MKEKEGGRPGSKCALEKALFSGRIVTVIKCANDEIAGDFPVISHLSLLFNPPVEQRGIIIRK